MTTDAKLREDILRELSADPRVEEKGLTIRVDHGVVTLAGEVTSYARRQAAEEAVCRVVGVLDVANEIDVHPPRDLLRSDEDIARAVRHALEWDVLIPHERVRSSVAQGWVTLEGSVDHPFEREAVDRAVGNLAGVQGLTNKIAVREAQLKEADLRQRIFQVLEHRAEQTANGITIRVHDGAVTLAGNVHSLAEREAVVGAVRSAPNVRGVVDDILIVPEVTALAI